MVAVLNSWFQVLVSAIFAFALLAFSLVANAQSFNPARVRVDAIEHSGTGCPAGTVTAVVAPDAGALTVLYDQFETRAGGATGQASTEANCRVNIRLAIPRFYSVNIESVDVRGFVGLERGVTGYQDIKVQTGHSKNPFNLSFGLQTWRGPIEQDFIVRSVRPLEGPNWLSCLPSKETTLINLRTRLKIEGGAPDREGLMSVDSVDGRMIQRYRLSWRNCLKDIVDAGRGGGIRLGGSGGVTIPFPF